MTKSSLMNFRRGDVVLAKVPMPSTLLTQVKLRPAVIISADHLNYFLDDVMVVPCTSMTTRSLTLTQYLITGYDIALAGIRVESVLRCDSIFTLNKSMIVRKLGLLSSEALDDVNHCLIAALELKKTL